jgi:hypothetical protein
MLEKQLRTRRAALVKLLESELAFFQELVKAPLVGTYKNAMASIEYGEVSIERARKELADLVAESRDINKTETLFSQPPTVYTMVPVVASFAENFMGMWRVGVELRKVEEGLTDTVFKVKPEDIEESIALMARDLTKVKRFFSADLTAKATLDVCVKLDIRFERLRGQLPLLACLCNPGLRDRHWLSINKVAEAAEITLKLHPNTLVRDLFRTRMVDCMER